MDRCHKEEGWTIPMENFQTFLEDRLLEPILNLVLYPFRPLLHHQNHFCIIYELGLPLQIPEILKKIR